MWICYGIKNKRRDRHALQAAGSAAK